VDRLHLCERRDLEGRGTDRGTKDGEAIFKVEAAGVTVVFGSLNSLRIPGLLSLKVEESEFTKAVADSDSEGIGAKLYDAMSGVWERLVLLVVLWRTPVERS